ncbi:MAG: hypothetical protein J7M38_14720 [Armatimonadetes bacterium]|nr:hypothetical protein [Armatimonadota bacterium]
MQWHVIYPGTDYVETWQMAVMQQADGNLRLYGVLPYDGDGEPPAAITSGSGYGLGPFIDYEHLNTWNMDVQVDTFGQLTSSLVNQGVENVTAANGVTYACYKWQMIWNMGNFPIPFTAWFNPQVGFVKIDATFQEGSGMLNVILTLQNTSFGL